MYQSWLAILNSDKSAACGTNDRLFYQFDLHEMILSVISIFRVSEISARSKYLHAAFDSANAATEDDPVISIARYFLVKSGAKNKVNSSQDNEV